MSDFIGHECGLMLLRLRRTPAEYQELYGDPGWGVRKLLVLMEKLRNRGQDGAGVGVVKFDMPPGDRFMLRVRSDKRSAIERIGRILQRDIEKLKPRELKNLDAAGFRRQCEFIGDVYIGHLRYGTHSGRGVSACHPLMRKNNVASRNLALAGNFNMTNSRELFEQLVEYGLHPVGDSDTAVILERIGYELDREHRQIASSMGPESFRGLENRELAGAVSDDIDLARVLRRASDGWDGGYAFAGLLGNGDAFVVRDPNGIRPAFHYMDDDVVVMASERAPLTNLFDAEPEQIEPLPPGHILEIKRSGAVRIVPFTEPGRLRQCTFERIYFSRGNDQDIYRERKSLGRLLAPRVLDALDNDVDHAVFSFVPNTAETSYLGLVEEVDRLHRARLGDELWRRIESGTASRDDVMALATGRTRAEKVAHKDQKMRTFITHDAARRDLVMHVYDITRGVVQTDDTLVVVDDSIVRGTTLRESIITILSRLNPKRIVVCSSAPPIMYPDCYGIDMSQLGRFIAFEAAIGLLEDRNELELLDEVEAKCLEQAALPPDRMVNHVGMIYDRFTLQELEGKIAQLVRPTNVTWDGPIEVMYQSVDDLRRAMPEHTGDWYFTGNFPTPGGYRVLNRSFLNWRRKVDVRAY
ncbi:MAG: amidophosphoribosyltransferase [Phycisphaerales bacterium]